MKLMKMWFKTTQSCNRQSTACPSFSPIVHLFLYTD